MTTETQTKADLPLTAGQEYVARFLSKDVPNAADVTVLDAGWVGDCLDAGTLVACPRCQFVRLAQFPFGIDDIIARDNPGLTEADCDVCALLPQAARFDFNVSLREGLQDALLDLSAARISRANALYDYWMGATIGADAFVWAAMRNGMDAAGIPAPPQEVAA